MTVTEQFINSIWSLAEREFPERVREQAKLCVIDYLACASLGSSLLKKENETFLSSFQFDCGEATVIGLHKKTSTHCAAMLNGINAHMIELDDGHRYAMLHLGAPVISAMLAAAQTFKIDAAHFIKGIVIGYEATIRLASAIQPGHKLKGYHATGTCATIGAAVGIAVALGYEKDKLNTVISAAATDAAGILQVIDESSQMKPYNVGRAASAAINAACMGSTGLEGPSDVLGGKRGFFAVMADAVKLEYLVDGFMPAYGIERIYRKPYAACRHCHAAIEAALNICKERNFTLGEVRDIKIETYGLAVKGHEHKVIKGASSAKMSMPYSVAAGIVFGKVNYQQYEKECLNDPRIAALMDRISVVEDPELSKLVPGRRAAVVTIRTEADVYEKRVDYPLGEPENPMTRQQLEEKYFSLMNAAGRTESESRKLLSDIYSLETKYQEFLQEL